MILVTYTHQVRKHIGNFECGIAFTKSRRDDMFIEKIYSETLSSSGATYWKSRKW